MTHRSLPDGIALSILTLVYLVHFAAIASHAVDIPVRDEFVVYLESPHYLGDSPHLDWLLRRHNEHRFVLTRLQGWLLYRINGWNLVSQQVMNFILWGGFLALVLRFGQRLRPPIPLWASACFAVFLLSPLGYVNHAWGVQSQFHFSLIFFLAASWCLFCESQQWRPLAAGVACSWLAIYSQAGGAVACLALLSCYLLFKAIRVRAAQSPAERRRESAQGLMVLVLLGLGLATWLVGFQVSPGGQRTVYPWTALFWKAFVNQASHGFGYTAISTPWGVVCLALVLAPVVVQFLQHRGRPSVSFWRVSVLLVGILAILAATAFSRGAFKGPRYFQYSVCLLPFCSFAWHALLCRRPRILWCALTALWLVCAFGFKDHLSLAAYGRLEQQRKYDQQRIRAYYLGLGPLPDGLFPPGLRRPVALYLANAKKLQVSFTRGLSLEPSSLAAVPPATLRNDLPLGFLNGIGDDGWAFGWALDPDQFPAPIDVHFYVDGPAGRGGRFVGRTAADQARADVGAATGYPGNHGFRYWIPEGFRDGRTHLLFAYGIDADGGRNPELAGSGRPFQLPPPHQ